MAKTQGGSVRLFQLFGIDVFLHWSWALVALIELERRADAYSSQVWNVAEYLGLFAIVLLHEFGHALACRSVGGKANRILLWPLGGVAFVSPPQRPGAVLWSIAAGPLVNVLLIPVLLGLAAGLGLPLSFLGFPLLSPAGPYAFGFDVARFVNALFFINVLLLVFNLLPIYPLDGGQILRSLLWFIIGPAYSLMVAAVIGLVGAAGVFVLAAWARDFWLILMAGFGAMQSWNGLRYAQAMLQTLKIPRYAGLQCPACGVPPPVGPFWQCECGNHFDVFAAQGACPQCGRGLATAPCPTCRQRIPLLAWWYRPTGVPLDGTRTSTPLGQQQPVQAWIGQPSDPAQSAAVPPSSPAPPSPPSA